MSIKKDSICSCYSIIFLLISTLTILFLNTEKPFAEDILCSKNKAEFRNAIQKALHASEIDKFRALFYEHNVDKDMMAYITKQIESILTERGKIEFNFGSLPDKIMQTKVYDGFIYKLNLKPNGVINFEFSKSYKTAKGESVNEDNIISFEYGVVDGCYRFAGIEKSAVVWDGPTDKPLRILITAENFQENTVLAGFCIYNASGIDIREELSLKGSSDMNFAGQYVKECYIKKLSKQNWFRLEIFEGEKCVYDSGKHTETSPIHYKRNKGVGKIRGSDLKY